MDKALCSAITKKGTKCSYKAREDGFCGMHTKSRIKVPETPIVEKKEEVEGSCPICMEKVRKEEDVKISCGHQMHLECAKQLHDSRCPICRLEINEKNSSLKKQYIHDIKKKRKKDLDEMSLRLAMEYAEERDEEEYEEEYEDEEEYEEINPEIFNDIFRRALEGFFNREITNVQRFLVKNLTVEAYLSHTDVYSDDFCEFLQDNSGVESFEILREIVNETVSELLK